MQRNQWVFNYQGTELNYYYRPGQWMTDEEFAELMQMLEYVNHRSGLNFTYGIFDKNNNAKEILSNMLICVMKIDNMPSAFFYNVIVSESPVIIHQGLVVIAKSKGSSIMAPAYALSNCLLYNKLGQYDLTSISSVPSIIGSICDLFDDVWPNPLSANQIKPPHKHYNDVVKVVFEKYVKKFFPNPESLTLNEKRFVITSTAADMGFERDFRKMPRHESLQVNLFCQFWIDYNKDEDMIQAGRFTDLTYSRLLRELNIQGISL